MKRILLTSTAIAAFAGAASAEVTFGGDAHLSYNTGYSNSGALSYGLGLTVGASQELNNGMTVSGSLDIDIGDRTFVNTGTGATTTYESDTFGGLNISASDWVLKVSSDAGTLSFGDVAPSADSTWSGVTNMNDDGFNDEGDNGEEAVLKADATFGGTSVSVSSNLDNDGKQNAMQLGVTTTVSGWTLGLAHQDKNNTAGAITGVFAKGEVGGVSLHVAHSKADAGNKSTGIGVSYPTGDVTVGAFYVMEDAEDDNYGLTVDYASGPLTLGVFYHGGGDEDHGINMTYDMGNGLTMDAGYSEDEKGYAGVKYDLGGGASASATYGSIVDAGPGEDIDRGAELKLSFSF